jgi:hypothetical protein
MNANQEQINNDTQPQTNRKFDDNTLIDDIIEYYIKTHNIKKEEIDSYVLKMLLLEKVNRKCSIGIDFKFNIMRNVRKIDFDNAAPDYREVNDGLNFFAYCLNEDCQLYNEYFTISKGYGIFDLVAEANGVECPKCGKHDKELRNIGVINSKWQYKGFLKQGKESKFSGDASTFENDKLYILNEINFKSEFKALLIEVAYHKTKVHKERRNMSGDNESDLDDYDLFYDDNNCENGNGFVGSSYSCNGIDNTKFISEETVTPIFVGKNGIEVQKEMVNIDGRDKICCVGCDGKKTKESIFCVVF